VGETNGIAKRPVTTVEHFNPDDTGALYMQTSLFEQVQRAATMLSRSNLVPTHLRGDDKVADCFLVIEQAMRWRMSPFAVAQSTYVLSGKLGYEGKLITAVVNASPRLSKSLNFEYSGKGQERQVRVYGTLRGEETPREVVGTVAAWKTNNKQWETQVDQMLSYRGAREWARRHMPEVILGVYAEEELEQIASRPTATTVSVETLEDFVTPSQVEASDDHKGKVGTTPEYAGEPKPVVAEIVKPQPKTATVIDVGEAVKAEKAAAAKKTPKDKTIDDLFG
jgi:hypothetical protein